MRLRLLAKEAAATAQAAAEAAMAAVARAPGTRRCRIPAWGRWPLLIAVAVV